MQYGWGLASHGTVFPIQDLKIESESVDENQNSILKSFKLKINSKHLIVADLTHRQNGFCVLTINGHKSSGLMITDRQLSSDFKQIEPNMDLVDVFKLKESEELVLTFDDRTASNERLTGGKGSSLCLLKGLSQFNGNEFIVPNGFVITTNAYKMLLRENPEILKSIERLQTISWFVS